MAIGKGKLLIAGMVGAIGIPYVVHDSKTQAMINREWKSVTGKELFSADAKGDSEKALGSVLEEGEKASGDAFSKVQNEFDAKAAELSKKDPRELLPESARAALRDASNRPSAAPPEGAPVQDLGEIFRFDVIPRWIITRWGTVNRSVTNSEFETYRVPVVTGKQSSDLTGALTYYFDANDVVQRISFLGSTYDEKRLVEFMTTKYQLKKEPALGPDLYGVRWSGKLRSALVIDFDPSTSRGQAPKMLIRFELNRPRGGNYGLSNEFAALLSSTAK